MVKKIHVFLLKKKIMSDSVNNKGFFEIIYGCMFSGKTTSLNKLLYEHFVNKRNVLKITHSDVQGMERNSVIFNPSLEKDKNSIYLDHLSKDTIFNNDYDVIGIDEGQLFNEDIKGFIKHYLGLGKIIILAGLITDYRMEVFGFIPSLFYL